MSTSFIALIDACIKILSDKPLFFLVNSYTTGISSTVIKNILKMNLKIKNGKYSCGEIGLPMTDSKLTLPCGIFAKWEK